MFEDNSLAEAPSRAEDVLVVNPTVVMLRVADLIDAVSPRTLGVDLDHVRALAAVEEPLPPILVHAGSMRVIDGMHRLTAARHQGRTEIRAQLFHGSEHDAFRLGVRANVVHGLPLSTADRHAAAEQILRAQPLLSDRSVAGTTGLATRTVAALRRRMTDDDVVLRIGKDGRVRPLSAAEGRLAASQVIAARPDASLREIAREAGISVGTAHDVRLRLRSGRDPVPAHTAAAHGPGNRAVVGLVVHPIDVDKAMEHLRRDPSVRYSDSGRTLMRWLEARIVTARQLHWSSDQLPAHSLSTVEKIARECARVWSEFADEVGGSAA